MIQWLVLIRLINYALRWEFLSLLLRLTNSLTPELHKIFHALNECFYRQRKEMKFVSKKNVFGIGSFHRFGRDFSSTFGIHATVERKEAVEENRSLCVWQASDGLDWSWCTAIGWLTLWVIAIFSWVEVKGTLRD